VEFLSGIADNFVREVLIGREHVQKVPQWYGETVGFWDGDTLITWTANVQGWTQHTLFEFSGKMETVETYQPLYNSDHHFVGLLHEAVWYDPESLVQPVRLRDRFLRRAEAGDPNARQRRSPQVCKRDDKKRDTQRRRHRRPNGLPVERIGAAVAQDDCASAERGALRKTPPTLSALPTFSSSTSDRARVSRSAAPPGGKGTMSLTGCVGHACA
jgi:hypothetical protein